MTFSYDIAILADPNDPDYPRTYLRMRLGDMTQLSGTGATGRGILADEEYDQVLAEFGGDFRAALIPACDRILAALAKDVDKDGAGLRSNRAQKTQHYRDLRIVLSRELVGLAVPELTGDSWAEYEELAGDEDFRGVMFERGQFTDPTV